MIPWLIALGILILLAILPLGISALYNTDGPMVRVIIGPVRLTVFPGKKKKEDSKPKAKKRDKTNSESKKQKKTEPSQKGGSWTDFLPLVKTALAFLGGFRRKLRVNRLQMKLVLGGLDPCDLAVNYGKTWAAVGNLMPHLENLFVIKKRDVEVQCDFTADSTLIFARLDLTITLGRLLLLALRYGVRALVQYITIINKRKGGARI